MCLFRCFNYFLVTALLSPMVCIAAATAPATAPALQTFEDKSAQIHFEYPAPWIREKANTALFAVQAPPADKCYAALSLDVPSLPPLVSHMISVERIESGYVDDLKKNQIKDAKVDESVALKLPGCRARRVKCSGHENGKPMTDVAVILIHDSRVYIFSCDGDTDGYTSARSALDESVASIKWMK